ncbi:MAG TPA: hypothetical protein VFK38_11200, partial [Candidatus Limnocylindrales bacterium]|nr:hypothetical protein [Candidatus Limnocylindrales bacterium]
MPARRLELGGPFDPLLTLGPLVRGPYDPTFKLGAREAWRATRTDDGPATLHLEFLGAAVRAEAFGPGADRVLAALPELLGETDDRTGWLRRHPVVERLDRRFVGLRLPRTGAVFEALLPAILEQKIHGVDAQRSYGRLVRALGEPAPGPARLRLRVPPDPRRLAALPYE